ncbi:ras association domain-containing protein 10-like [Branchiostoma floridae]|uniref:Ras association domain-containing protein 10-like n=1 Tax=Branchiostoma floridae TaxID=7739 RepID=A0A9J7MMM6_BRAFL|nr:ras association domain-containing protein 10-like [Branchiostoma floridae]XP_035673503.1 ras association domain-containing protein 10-like [Branchiostoma floridae]XP_035673504.1 ras association domain-containing protein 10-like [Branchiostoma floridae]XP_035673505.1 ras association domain-containing protein 10-like [Branchiostoma floridae]XP_035673506.1 ras association domain-containing protein 10-like [Branchiostoma floridae]XP_035673507.1 ras association domain-containing protein 10-like 
MPTLRVWVDGEERTVSGISKRTTCGDVVKAMMAEYGLVENGHSYMLFERWRDCERTLPVDCRIMRVWKAWGPEQENVKFSLRKYRPTKAAAFEALHMNKVKRSHSVSKKEKHKSLRHARRTHTSKTADVRPKASEQPSEGTVEKTFGTLEELVQIVVKQQNTIEEQLRRIQATDGEIERLETRIHLARVKLNGTNYVQDTYLAGLEDSDLSDTSSHSERAEELERLMLAYIHTCEDIFRLQEHISLEETRMEDLSMEIQDEVSFLETNEGETRALDWGKDSMGQDEPKHTTDPSECKPDHLLQEVIRQTCTLESNIDLTQHQREEMRFLERELSLRDKLIRAKHSLVQELYKELEELEAEDRETRDHAGNEAPKQDLDAIPESKVLDLVESNTLIPQQGKGDTSPKGSTGSYENDSDTGLSSLHSQDDVVTVVETLV